LNETGAREVRYGKRKNEGGVMIGFILWLILFMICWPLALFALFMYPVVWLLLLPFRLVGIALDGVLSLIAAIITLPARVLRGR
jgi:hypothetical protein